MIPWGRATARVLWRAAIDSRDPVRSGIAVAALAYAAMPEDSDRLMPYRHSPVARIRAYALRGLARATAPALEHILVEALRDPNGDVVRTVLRLFAKEGPQLESHALQQAYVEGPSDSIRRRLLHGSRLLGKWDTLAFLLPLVDTVDSVLAVTEIKRWQRTSIRRFTPLDPAMRLALTSGLKHLQETRPSTGWGALLDIIRSS